jgi:hypothetical protein
MFPNFLCIGAQKSGTTWLYENLKQHPEVWLTPVKEIHFFDYYLYHPSPFHLRFYTRRWREYFRSEVKHYLSSYDFYRLKWDLKYFFKPHTIGWYSVIFEPGRGKKTGDITPAYSKLDLNQVSYIHELMPNAKIIFLMRNPIDRAWSQVKMLAENNNLNPNTISREFIFKTLNSKRHILRGDYKRTLYNWQTYYKEQFFVGFFEEITECPEDFLIRLCKFLEINASREFVLKTISDKINIGINLPVPPDVANYLAKMYYEDLKELYKLFDGYTGRWLECADKLLNN